MQFYLLLDILTQGSFAEKNMFCPVAEMNLTMYFLCTQKKNVPILLIHYIPLLICHMVLFSRQLPYKSCWGYDHKSNLLSLITIGFDAYSKMISFFPGVHFVDFSAHLGRDRGPIKPRSHLISTARWTPSASGRSPCSPLPLCVLYQLFFAVANH
jgi:hypothetical protein